MFSNGIITNEFYLLLLSLIIDLSNEKNIKIQKNSLINLTLTLTL